MRIARRRVDLDADEVVAELLLVARPARVGHGAVLREAQAEHAEVVVRDAVLHAGEVGVGEAERAGAGLAERERHRRLAQHRCEHLVVDGHREREAAAEAHADRADAGPAGLRVQIAGERAQPRDDRRRLVERQVENSLRDAHLAERLRDVADRHRPARARRRATASRR